MFEISSHPGVRPQVLPVGGAKPRGKAQGPSLRPRVRPGEGKTGRVNASEPLKTPRYPKPCNDGMNITVTRSGRWKRRRAAPGFGLSGVRTPLTSEFRGHPSQSHLAYAKRGNPAGVRIKRSGKPIVRGAQSLGRNRMPKKRTPECRKATGLIAIDRPSKWWR